jgi:hypothetical protein
VGELDIFGCVMYSSVLSKVIYGMIDDSICYMTEASIETHGFGDMRHYDTGVCLESTRSFDV